MNRSETDQSEMDEWLTRARDALAETAGIPASELELTRDIVVTLLDLAVLARGRMTAAVSRRRIPRKTVTEP